MPGLEILADDVRCTHGATSARWNPKSILFESRGIDDLAAKRLIARVFSTRWSNRLPEEQLSEYLHQQIEARL